jgi:hypothetical protein
LFSHLLLAQSAPPRAAKRPQSPNAAGVPIRNFTDSGKQFTRFDAAGDAIDAHDGEIAQFGGMYYLYGTSYDCGFAWQNPKAPFCGFKVYSSPDLTNWTDRGYLFDAQTPVWQSRCNGNTYGCFRPHVIYNAKTKQYVLWINVYDNRVGFRVFTSAAPTGPFQEVAVPTLALNSTAAVAGLNNGDHDTFVDDDGTAYIAYTDWHAKGAIVVEQLTADYLSGSGQHVAVTKEKTEAPGLFKRKGRYYLTYSDPNCGYCSGTGTSYRTARTPLGPWSEGVKISDNSCGGQPSFVSTIKLTADSLFLYGSDLWNNAARNEALANYYWTPLTFNADGSIKPIDCPQVAAPRLITGQSGRAATKAGATSATQPDYVTQCNVAGEAPQRQTFTATQTGVLTTLSLTAFKKDNPNAPLQLAIYSAAEAAAPTATPLYSVALPADSITWAAKNRVVHPNLRVAAGKSYVLQVSSAASVGCYGLAYADTKKAIVTPAAILSDQQSPAQSQAVQRVLKLQVFIRPSK